MQIIFYKKFISNFFAYIVILKKGVNYILCKRTNFKFSKNFSADLGVEN